MERLTYDKQESRNQRPSLPDMTKNKGLSPTSPQVTRDIFFPFEVKKEDSIVEDKTPKEETSKTTLEEPKPDPELEALAQLEKELSQFEFVGFFEREKEKVVFLAKTNSSVNVGEASNIPLFKRLFSKGQEKRSAKSREILFIKEGDYLSNYLVKDIGNGYMTILSDKERRVVMKEGKRLGWEDK